MVGWLDVFTKKEYCEIILTSLSYCQKEKGLIIHAWCIMSSHLHLIVSSKQNKLEDILRDFKTFTSKAITQQLITGNDSRKEWMLSIFKQEAGKIKRVNGYKVWQDGNHPVQLDTNKMLDERLNYLHQNPVEAGMVLNEEDYFYSSAKDYANQKGLLEIELIE
ncbi:MAG TPA: transposase [Bacteroidia bacterium]|nr:transposase [Bacteroidia bacterium]HRH06977.1 transposase [Bacteroidia bacterium]